MMSRAHVTTLISIAAAVWGAMLVMGGTDVEAGWIKPLGTVVGLLMLLLAGFNKWFWKLRLLYPWFVPVPDLTGTWKGQLVSEWIDHKTGRQVPPIETYLLVKQTFSEVQMRLMTKESASELLTGTVVREGTSVLAAGLYRNTPKLNHRDRSPMHHGGLLLQVQGIDEKDGLRLEGQYWTDRKTRGTLKFIERTSKSFDDFDRASEAKYEA